MLGQISRRFITTGRPQLSKWPNRKQKIGAWEQHNFQGAVSSDKIMPKSHFIGSLLALSLAGWAVPQYIQMTQAGRIKKKKGEIEI